MAADGSRKAILAAFFANLGIAIAKLVAFTFTQASSMLAEAIHSFADTGNQALLLLGGSRAKRLESAEHPFGYARVRYFWAFVVALVLFSVGGLFAMFEGVEKFRHPHEIDSAGWAFGVLTFAIFLEAYSFRTAVVAARPLKGDRTWWQFVRQTKRAELAVVLLEDLGAMIGLVVALVGVSLAVATGEPRWDAIGTLTIGVLLVGIAIILAIEMQSLLIGESAGTKHIDAMKAAIESTGDALIHMRTQHLGPEELLVAAKVQFNTSLTMSDLAHAVDATEVRIREAVPMDIMIYLEPDLLRTTDPT